MFYPDISRLSADFRKYLQGIAYLEHYAKGKTLISPSDQVTRLWYIQKGLAKIYHYTTSKDDPKQLITCFLKEQEVLTCVNSFFGREPNQEYIELLEDCSLYVVTELQFDECLYAYPEAQELAREIILGYKQRSDTRAELLSMPADLRFNEFSRRFNTGRLSINDLSAYLHVSRTHLNRIRKIRGGSR